MKQIKISDDAKEKLDSVKENNESYNNLIYRLVKENEELKKDKKFLANAVRVLLLGKLLKGDFNDIQSEEDLKFLFEDVNYWINNKTFSEKEIARSSRFS